MYWPPLQRIFPTKALTFGELLLCMALSTMVFWAVEIQKFVGQRSAAHRVPCVQLKYKLRGCSRECLTVTKEAV